MREHVQDKWEVGKVTFATVLFRSADDQSGIAELRYSNTGERLGTCTATPGSADFAAWVSAMVAAGRARAAEIAG
ncbi:MAG: hypothetical protein QM473_04335 [Acidobacteriota bacterium]|nr:hypothetical protein [Acidobacteriota bacterium]